MTTKPTVVCPNCHEDIDLEAAEDGTGVTCAACGTALQATEQPGVATPGPEHPQEEQADTPK